MIRVDLGGRTPGDLETNASPSFPPTLNGLDALWHLLANFGRYGPRSFVESSEDALIPFIECKRQSRRCYNREQRKVFSL